MLFRSQDAGIQVGLIRDRMEETANIARVVGQNSSAVFDLVRSNLSKLNEYGFKDGVEGLSRMAAKASAMRFEMYQVFSFAEKVFSPEGAIEAVSAFQRLGVAVGDLADPFRLMYLASEDVEGLTDQVIQMTDKFSYFDEKSKEFKIFPNAKRDMRDLAQQMGISYDNLVKMSFAQQKLNLLSSQFKFTNFNKDDQQLIANFAQFSKEKNDFVIKVAGGEKLVTQLNSKDIEELRGKPETLEEIAQAQLTEQQLLNNTIQSLVDLLAGIPVGNKMTQDLQQLIRASVEGFNVVPTTISNSLRGGLERVNNLYKDLPSLFNEIYQDLAAGNLDFEKYQKKLLDSSTEYVNGLDDLAKKITQIDIPAELLKRLSDDNLLGKMAGGAIKLIESLINEIGSGYVTPLKESISKANTQLNGIETTDVNTNLGNLSTQAGQAATQLGNLNAAMGNKTSVTQKGFATNTSLTIKPEVITSNVLASSLVNQNQNVLFSPIKGNIELKVTTQDGRSVDVPNQIVNSDEFRRKVIELISEKMTQPTYSNLPNSTQTV